MTPHHTKTQMFMTPLRNSPTPPADNEVMKVS